MICFLIFLILTFIGYTIYPNIYYEYFTYYHFAFAVTLSFACSLCFVKNEKTNASVILVLNFVLSNLLLWPHYPDPVYAVAFDTVFAVVLYAAGAETLAVVFALMSATNAFFYFFPSLDVSETSSFISASRADILGLLGHLASVALSSDSGDDWTLRNYEKFFTRNNMFGVGRFDYFLRRWKNN